MTSKFNYLDFTCFIQTGLIKSQTRSQLKLQKRILFLYLHLKLPFWISTSHRVWEAEREWMYSIKADQYVHQKGTLSALVNHRCPFLWTQRLADDFVLQNSKYYLCSDISECKFNTCLSTLQARSFRARGFTVLLVDGGVSACYVLFWPFPLFFLCLCCQ